MVRYFNFGLLLLGIYPIYTCTILVVWNRNKGLGSDLSGWNILFTGTLLWLPIKIPSFWCKIPSIFPIHIFIQFLSRGKKSFLIENWNVRKGLGASEVFYGMVWKIVKLENSRILKETQRIIIGIQVFYISVT